MNDMKIYRYMFDEEQGYLHNLREFPHKLLVN